MAKKTPAPATTASSRGVAKGGSGGGGGVSKGGGDGGQKRKGNDREEVSVLFLETIDNWCNFSFSSCS